MSSELFLWRSARGKAPLCVRIQAMGLSEPINLELAGLPFSGLPFPQAKLQLKKKFMGWGKFYDHRNPGKKKRRGENKERWSQLIWHNW